MVLQHIDNLDR